MVSVMAITDLSMENISTIGIAMKQMMLSEPTNIITKRHIIKATKKELKRRKEKD